MPIYQKKSLASQKFGYASILARLTTNISWPKKESKGPANESFRPLANEDGFVLIAAMTILLVLVILGITSTTTTNIEIQIAGNDKVSKQTFYLADGGTDLGSRMVEENIACPTGFNPAFNPIGGLIPVQSLAFWQTTPANLTDPTLAAPDFGDADNDGTDDDGDGFDDRAFFYIPSPEMATNVIVAGTTQYGTGSAIQMTSGYEGTGRGSAAGGSAINYTIISQGRGSLNSASEVQILWRHTIGQEGDCNY